MKKAILLASLIFALAVSVFAQDGRTKINFYNHTSVSLRFFVGQSPACTGDVIPGGFCVEPVNPGTYLVYATAGNQTSPGKTCSVADGEYCDYTVYEQEGAQNLNGDEKLTVVHAAHTPRLQRVSLRNYGLFNVDAPVELKTDGATSSTTSAGKPYTQTIWSSSLPNGDLYMAATFEYTFQVAYEDLDRGIEAFRAAIGGKLLKVEPTTVSGSPAKMAGIETNDGATRVAIIIAFRGNKAYVFAFSTDKNAAGTDMDAVKAFFNSATLN